MSLTVTDLVVRRGPTTVIGGVNFEVPSGEVTVLLGPNGAGKTTLLEALSGVLPVAGGSVRLGGRDVSALPRSERARAGIAHVQQGRAVFPSLSVEDNLRVGAHGGDLQRAFALFPELEKRRSVAAGKLSGGEQQMVVARALLGNPGVIFLDEMSLGLAPLVVRRLIPVVRRLADDGMGVLLVEQFAQLALSIGDRGLVLSGGRLVLENTCAALRRDPARLQQTYLGTAQPA